MGLIADALKTEPLTGPVVKTPAVPAAQEGPMTPWGWVANLGGDVVDLARGTGSLLGMLVHDAVFNPLAEAVTLGKYESEWMTPQFLKALPSAIQQDYASRYGFHGGKEVVEQLYENPLSYILDALAVVNAAGKVGALAAARSPSFAATKLGQIATPKAIETVAPFGLKQADVEAMELARGGVPTQWMPKPEFPLVRQFPTAASPTHRFYQRVGARLFTEEPETVAARVKLLREQLADETAAGFASDRLAERIAQMDEAINTAKTLGLRVEKNAWTTHRVARLTDQFIGRAGLRHVMRRDELVKVFKDVFEGEDLGIPDEYIPDIIMGLNSEQLIDDWVRSRGVSDTAAKLAGRSIPTGSLRDTEAMTLGVLNDPKLASFDKGPLVFRGTRAEAEDLRISAMEKLMDDVGESSLAGSRVKALREMKQDEVNAEALGKAADTADTIGIQVRLNNWKELPEMVRRVEAALGPIERITNTLGEVGEDARRGFRAVYAYQGQPIEVRFGTDLALDVERAQTKLADFYDASKAMLARGVFSDEFPASFYARERDASRRLMSHLTGAVTDQLREEFQGATITPARRMMHRLRIAVAREYEAPMFRDRFGGFTPAAALDRMYRPLQAELGFKYVKGKHGGGGWFRDGVPVEATDFDAFLLDDARAVQGYAAPVYFPLYDSDLMDKAARKFLMSKGTMGARTMAKPGYEKALTGKLLENRRYVKDPARVYAMRAAEQVRWEESANLVEELATTFGRVINSKDPYAQVGDHEVVFAPDGFARMIRTRSRLDKAAVRAELDIAEGGGEEALRKFADEVLEEAENQLDSVLTLTKQGVEMYAVPRVVAERIQKSLGPKLGLKTRLFWDKPTELWRTWVLGGSPRWILNNLVGNYVFLKMQGGKLSDVLRQGVSPEFHRKLELVIGPDADKFVSQGFIRTEARGTHLGYAAMATDPTESHVARWYQALGESRATRVVGSWPEHIKKLNTEVETAFRRASYMTAAQRVAAKGEVMSLARKFWTSKEDLRTIAKVGVDPAKWSRAVDEMNYWLNDYSQATPFARNYLRRFIFPFWAFYRHIGKLVLRMPYDYPIKGTVMRNLAMVANDMGQHFGPLPLWAEGAVPLAEGEEPGSVRFLSTTGMNPFSLLFGTPMDLLHPAFKMLYEQSTGQSAYRHREFSDPSVFTPFGSSQQYRVYQDDQGVWHEDPIERTAPDIVEHIMQQFPFYSTAKNLVAGATPYDTSNLLDILMMRFGLKPEEAVIPIDPATGEPRYSRNALDEFVRFMGMPTFEVNQAELEQQRFSDQLAALRGILRRYGVIPPATEGGSSTSNPFSAPAGAAAI